MEKEENAIQDFKQFIRNMLGDNKDRFRDAFIELSKREDREGREKFVALYVKLSRTNALYKKKEVALRKWSIEQSNRGGRPDICLAEAIYNYVTGGIVPEQPGSFKTNTTPR